MYRPPSYARALTLCLGLSLPLCGLALSGCGDDDDDGVGDAGSQCGEADDCYPDVEDGDLVSGGMAGAATKICLDRTENGYCTHTCQTDADCCAAEGECDNDFPQVCAPFESTGMMMCFLSCEETDGLDENEFCGRYAARGFNCRSTGGGAANRKVCFP